MKNINRRENPRMDIILPCHVSSPPLWMRSAMFTENISRNGLLIGWRGDGALLPVPAIGQIITIEVELPVYHEFGQKCIHCQGAVVRVTQTYPEFPSVAMRVTYMDFREFHDSLHNLESLQPIANAWMA